MGYCVIPEEFFTKRKRRKGGTWSTFNASVWSVCERKRKMCERMKDDESDAPCLTAVCLAHSAHITLLLFSHTGLREASHGHLEARRLTTGPVYQKQTKKQPAYWETRQSNCRALKLGITLDGLVSAAPRWNNYHNMAGVTNLFYFH